MLTNKKSFLALSVVSALALTACGSDNDKNVTVTPPDVVEVVPPSELITEQPSKVFLASVTDSANADVLVGASVAFVVDGVAATELTDVNGNSLASAVVDESGSFTFLSKEGATGEVTAIVNQSGYASKSFIVNLDAEVEEGSKNIPLEFSLVKIAGSSLKESTQAVPVDGAVTSAELKLESSTESGKGKTDVAIDASTELRDANGAPVSGGDVSLSVLAADSSNGSVGAIIPEGLNAAGAANVAKPLGVTSVNMKAGTTKIKQFSKPITLTTTLPASSGVTVGQELDLASHNEDTGKWQNETNKATVVAQNSDGTFTARFKSDHLTFFSVNKNAPVCQSGVSLNVTSGTVPARGLAVSITSTDGSIGSYLRGSSKQIVSGNATSRYGISADAKANVRIYDYSGNDWYNSNGEINVCGTIPVTLGNPVQTFDSDFSLVGTCASTQNGTVAVDLSGSVVTYAKNGKAASVATSLGNSTFRLSGLEANSSYTIRSTVRGVQVSSGGQSVVTTFTTGAAGSPISQPVTLTCTTRVVTGG
ncbi:hypothetical protein NI389_18875 (plasmid) [Pseudoalteromonas xiamenensis]|uniref:hypothetical protein n=1 Tax=Pseudoalteromonas xiamenensis TaxID=882626 RepID=UPI0027E58355|nr:hypothetical protein [Pseudoalteromonas xiamenensis]WMN61870.1 hypothetical protein NI389_18875 [Pseudoalteromonas xiamenensis]